MDKLYESFSDKEIADCNEFIRTHTRLECVMKYGWRDH